MRIHSLSLSSPLGSPPLTVHCGRTRTWAQAQTWTRTRTRTRAWARTLPRTQTPARARAPSRARAWTRTRARRIASASPGRGGEGGYWNLQTGFLKSKH